MDLTIPTLSSPQPNMPVPEEQNPFPIDVDEAVPELYCPPPLRDDPVLDEAVNACLIDWAAGIRRRGAMFSGRGSAPRRRPARRTDAHGSRP
jgi:hypothetical protein